MANIEDLEEVRKRTSCVSALVQTGSRRFRIGLYGAEGWSNPIYEAEGATFDEAFQCLIERVHHLVVLDETSIEGKVHKMRMEIQRNEEELKRLEKMQSDMAENKQFFVSFLPKKDSA